MVMKTADDIKKIVLDSIKEKEELEKKLQSEKQTQRNIEEQKIKKIAEGRIPYIVEQIEKAARRGENEYNIRDTSYEHDSLYFHEIKEHLTKLGFESKVDGWWDRSESDRNDGYCDTPIFYWLVVKIPGTK